MGGTGAVVGWAFMQDCQWRTVSNGGATFLWGPEGILVGSLLSLNLGSGWFRQQPTCVSTVLSASFTSPLAQLGKAGMCVCVCMHVAWYICCVSS